MNNSKLYYIPPTEISFEELKIKAINFWKTYNNDYGYADEKLNAIKDMQNIRDNFMYIFAMFDQENQQKLIVHLSESTKDALRDRLASGGMGFNELSMLGL